MSHRVLVTGGQGFLGRHLAAHWLASDPTALVVSVGRSAASPGFFARTIEWGAGEVQAPLPAYLADALDSQRHSYEQVDVSDRVAMTELLARVRPTHVLHLAGQLRDDALERLLATNVLGAQVLIEAIRGAHVRPERVVMGSTGAVYGVPTELPIPEASPCRPLDLYACTKLSAEHIVGILSQRHDIPVAWARIFNPVGPGQDERHLTSSLAKQVAAIAAGLRPPRIEVGPLSTTRDFIDAGDVASALRAIAVSGQAGLVYNVGSGVETPIERTLTYSLRAAGLGPQTEVVQRPARASDVPRHVADISRLSGLGWLPLRDFKQSMTELVRYYSEDVAAAPQGGASGRYLEQLEVSIPRRDAYNVQVSAGLLKRLPGLLQARFPLARFALLMDRRVHELYGIRLVEAMAAAGVAPIEIVVADGEASKSPAAHQQVISALHESGFDRRSVLINLGGGMISDLGGYVAASYMRGVDYVNVPTTLLAQHDASIGGKVAVNTLWAKNFIGAFHHPRAVYVDPEVLSTLDARDISAGVAEAIKVGMCGDRPLLHLLESSVSAIRDRRDPAVLGQVVSRAAKHKLLLLKPDPYEVDLRRVLNLGHSVGHALETELCYTDLRHGEAVAWGIAVATSLSLRMGRCDLYTHDRLLALLAAYGLPPHMDQGHLHAALLHLHAVRLVRGGCLNEVLPTGFGQVEIVADVDRAELQAALHDLWGASALHREGI